MNPWYHAWALGIKELKSLAADRVLLLLMVWAFSGAVYEGATGLSQQLHRAPIAIVDEDASALSRQIALAFYPPHFRLARVVTPQEAAHGLAQGAFAFVLHIPPGFERELLGGRTPDLLVESDATLVSQAFLGASYIARIVQNEVRFFLLRHGKAPPAMIPLVPRVHFNPNLTGLWFGGVMETINNITLLTIILVGAAYLRERERGTIEHLLAMPITPWSILMAKLGANALAVLLGTTFAITVVVKGILAVPLPGSLGQFLIVTLAFVFAAGSIGIFLGTLARSLPQLGLLVILVIVPLQLLSGSLTPQESMPENVRTLMATMPTTYFVRIAQAILYRGATIDELWPHLIAMFSTGTVFLLLALRRFRAVLSQSLS